MWPGSHCYAARSDPPVGGSHNLSIARLFLCALLHADVRIRSQDAKQKLGIDASLIFCFLRHLGVEKAWETLKQVCPRFSSCPYTPQCIQACFANSRYILRPVQ